MFLCEASDVYQSSVIVRGEVDMVGSEPPAVPCAADGNKVAGAGEPVPTRPPQVDARAMFPAES